MDKTTSFATATPYLIEELAKTGIYCITQKSTGRRYIGSTAEGFYRRWKRHLNLLKRVKHHSLFFQRAWDNSDFNDFVFEIIEFYEVLNGENNQRLLSLEQYYLDTLKPEFNMSPSACNRKGVKVSEETRIKISTASKRQVRKPCTEETKKKISESSKGKQISIETRKKMADSKKGLSLRAINIYSLISPDGEVVIVDNLKKFCSENNLIYQNLFAVIRGDTKHSQGWTITKINR